MSIETQERRVRKISMIIHQKNQNESASPFLIHLSSHLLLPCLMGMSQRKLVNWFLYYLTFPHYGSNSIPHFRSLVLFTIFDCKTPLKEKHLSCCHSESFLLMDNHWMVHCICNGFLRKRIIPFYAVHKANNQSTSNHYFFTWSKICTKRMVQPSTIPQRENWIKKHTFHTVRDIVWNHRTFENSSTILKGLFELTLKNASFNLKFHEIQNQSWSGFKTERTFQSIQFELSELIDKKKRIESKSEFSLWWNQEHSSKYMKQYFQQ